MSKNGCIKITRGLIVFFSVLFVFIGLAITGLVAYLKLSEPPYSQAIPDVAKYTCLGLHTCLLISGLLGFCAGFWFKKWLFCIFLPILILTYASHLALAASLLINSSLVKETISETIDAWQREYQYNGKGDPVGLMDSIHQQFRCCGSQSYKDYRSGAADTLQIPWSCCNGEKHGATECQAKAYSLPFELAYDRGCRSVAAESSWETARAALFVSVGLSGLELLTVVLSLSLCCFCYGNGRAHRQRGVSGGGGDDGGGGGGGRRYSALPLPDRFPHGGHETVL